jgi:hypothetical protein
MNKMLLFALSLLVLLANSAAAQEQEQKDNETTTTTTTTVTSGGVIVRHNEHSDDYAWDAIEELSGVRPAADASRSELATDVLGLLNDRLPQYGQKSTPQVRSAIPEWFIDGYTALQPASVARSRYLNGVIDGTYAADDDIAALYAIYSVYDAEWFSLSRHADHKAWLSAVMLTYPPQWQRLTPLTREQLHDTYVAPIQTKNESFLEIDNWIKKATAGEGAFSKPTVRSALVMELLERAGAESDDRFFEDAAYTGPAPAKLNLSDREFFLTAALTLEFFQEIYELDPQSKQPLHLRDYFVGVFYSETEGI